MTKISEYLLHSVSLKLGEGDLAKYPFLNEAANYIRETGFELEEFNRPEMETIFNRSSKRIENEFIHGKFDETLERYDIEILTFLLSLLIVKSIDVDILTKRHSLFEARRAEKFLIADLKKERNISKKKLLVMKIFEELFKLKVEMDSLDNRHFRIRVVDYIKRAVEFHESEWRLINRMVNDGFVFLDVDEVVRLIRSELSLLIYNKIKSMKVNDMPIKIKMKADDLRRMVPIEFERKVNVKKFPPCINHAIQGLGKGENLSHSARVMLATYLINIGKSVEEILSIFSSAPDFNEKITRYQIEHLSGVKGSGKKYLIPSCYKLKNENLCFAIDECAGITNPIQFGRN